MGYMIALRFHNYILRPVSLAVPSVKIARYRPERLFRMFIKNLCFRRGSYGSMLFKNCCTNSESFILAISSLVFADTIISSRVSTASSLF